MLKEIVEAYIKAQSRYSAPKKEEEFSVMGYRNESRSGRSYSEFEYGEFSQG
jgi:hypothetical protein